jgi:hypothetical protein
VFLETRASFNPAASRLGAPPLSSFLRHVTHSDIYWPPLKLEDAKETTFLETTFRVNSSGQFDYWLKHDNEKTRKVWRYQHWRSHAPFAQKKALVVACMRKVHTMTSDKAQSVSQSVYPGPTTEQGTAIHECSQQAERIHCSLQYPTQLLRSICNLMA